MWAELLCGVVYRLFKRLFYGDDALDFDTTDYDVKFAVGSRLEKLYGGKVYLGLRIPDPDTGTRQNIDMVLVTKREAVVINVKNISGFAGIDTDGSWICSGDNRYSIQRHPDPVMETRRQVVILESYLEQRGVPLRLYQMVIYLVKSYFQIQRPVPFTPLIFHQKSCPLING